MFRYILIRLLIFIPTLFAISLLAFWLGQVAPGEKIPPQALPPIESGFEITDAAYEEIYQQFGLDKPLFYFSLSSAAYPDTLQRIPGRYHQQSLANLTSQYGNWPLIQQYNNALVAFSRAVRDLPDKSDSDDRTELRRISRMLLEEYKDPKIQSYLQTAQSVLAKSQDSLLQNRLGVVFQSMKEQYNAVQSNPTRYKLYLPAIKWMGVDNQYHHWGINFLQGDFGVSFDNGRPVIDKIKTPIYWTLIMNSIAIVLIYLLSVPLGVFSAVKKDSLWDKMITAGLFLLYSLPTFWVGTMLLVFFTNPEYGMDWFEGAGLGSLPSSAPFWDRFWETATHLILPVFCLTYGGLAFMSRQMRGGMLNVLNQDYIRTARAKGLSKKQVIWKHAFKNALFPMITIFALIFPAAVTGSIVIEQIFNIPGMGNELLDAIYAKDWPVLYTILMLVAILTMLGNLVADILYAFVDPRVKFSK